VRTAGFSLYLCLYVFMCPPSLLHCVHRMLQILKHFKFCTILKSLWQFSVRGKESSKIHIINSLPVKFTIPLRSRQTIKQEVKNGRKIARRRLVDLSRDPTYELVALRVYELMVTRREHGEVCMGNVLVKLEELEVLFTLCAWQFSRGPTLYIL
jgi:hypothetical protein